MPRGYLVSVSLSKPTADCWRRHRNISAANEQIRCPKWDRAKEECRADTYTLVSVSLREPTADYIGKFSVALRFMAAPGASHARGSRVI